MSSSTPIPSTNDGVDAQTVVQPDTQTATAVAVAEPATSRGFVLSVIAFCLAAIALVYLPIVFGLIGAILGFVARKRGERLGTAAMWTAIGCTLVGGVIGAVVGALTYVG